MCIQEYPKFKRNKDILLPHDLNAEEVVLNYLLMNKKSLIINNLHPHEFYNETNKILFEVMLELYNQEQSINQVTIANKLFDQNITIKRDYIKSLMDEKYIKSHAYPIDDYINVIKKTSDVRRLIKHSDEGDDIDSKLLIEVLNESIKYKLNKFHYLAH